MIKTIISSIVLSILLFQNISASNIASKSMLLKMKKKYGLFAARRFMALQSLIQELKNVPLNEKLNRVNNFWNQVRYSSDMKVWHKKDYWATPWEFLGKDRGDCEDYVIAKYLTLKELGVDPKKMYFIYAVVKGRKVPHMVLGYYKKPDSIPLILDSLNYKIFPADKRKDLIPVYLFNGDTLKRFHKSKRKISSDKTALAKRKWDSLMQKIKRNVL